MLVTLGGCHLLDSLVVCLRREVRKKIVRCSREVIVRGIVLTPREPRRATLVEQVLALLSLNELLRKRTETDCSFHQRVCLGYRIQGTISFD